jgi:hypothetical protein
MMKINFRCVKLEHELYRWKELIEKANALQPKPR